MPSDLRAITARLTDAILTAADPARALAAHWPVQLDTAPRITLIATGKASAPMTEAALEQLASTDSLHRLTRAAITCVPEHEPRVQAAFESHNPPNARVDIHPADHPLATERNTAAAAAIANAARSTTQADTALALISGGASAHLTLPAGPLTLDHIRSLTNALLRAGAPIQDLNAVRKHLEQLKGGRLAKLLHPSTTHALVLSDVLGDPLHTIGSGPTAPDPSTYADALAVLDARNLTDDHPEAAAHLRAGALGQPEETPKPGDPCFTNLTHTIIANNHTALAAAERELTNLGFHTALTRENVQGEAHFVAADLIAQLADALDHHPRPLAVLFAGETTVTVGDSEGKGGRNQELALAAALELERRNITNAAVITLATDGIDGPTDAAGAAVSESTPDDIRAAHINPAAALNDHDSHTALAAAGALIRTGPTGTNINDIAAAIAW